MASKARARLPEIVGITLFARPHVAAGAIVSHAHGLTFQPCAQCGLPLVFTVTGSGVALACLATGECVGDDCPGPRPNRTARP